MIETVAVIRSGYCWRRGWIYCLLTLVSALTLSAGLRQLGYLAFKNLIRPSLE